MNQDHSSNFQQAQQGGRHDASSSHDQQPQQSAASRSVPPPVVYPTKIAKAGGIQHSITAVAPSAPRSVPPLQPASSISHGIPYHTARSAAPAVTGVHVPMTASNLNAVPGTIAPHLPLQSSQTATAAVPRQTQIPTPVHYGLSRQQRPPTIPPNQQSFGYSVPNPLQRSKPPGSLVMQPHQTTTIPAGAQAQASSQAGGVKPKVVLSPEARQALAKAIWSAIRSPTGEVDPTAMADAVQAGLPRHAVLNAARVARDREALKRLGQQQQAALNSSAALLKQTQQRLSGSVAPIRVAMPPASAVTIPTSVSVSSSSKPTPSRPSVSSLNQRKMEERNNWQHVHSGVFYVLKGRYLGLPNSIAACVRAPRVKIDHARKPLYTVLPKLKLIQDAERRLKAATVELLKNPETMKRVKMEPKRISKALDKAMKKARQTTQESLLKKLKDLNKSIVAHSSDFFKYHRAKRIEASKLAKAVRDRKSKQETAERKQADQAERARIAALKANDMEAYKSLLENTKNERLQYLWKKTDECLEQISSLLQERNNTKLDHPTSYYASAHLMEEEVRQPSILIGGELKEYQLAGLQWMVSLYNNKLNGILADEMGLGKTIQAISLVSYLMEFKENLGPYLVIVPLSTLSNWVNEFAKWCPAARVVVYKGTPGQRRELYKTEVRNGQFNVLLTTYEYIIRDKGSLKKVVWQYAIVDEGHRMKNAESKFAVTLGSMYTTKNRILLTGTPLQNNLPELWALLNFLLPAIFSSIESFDQWFNRPFASFSTASQTEDEQEQMLTNEERMLIIHRLHELLRPFMLRRVKSEVLDQLPEKVEKVLRCELSSWQKELYKQISHKAKVDNSLESFVQQPNSNRGLNNVVMQLRKVCNHPYLFSSQGYVINDDLIRCSGKFQLLDEMLPKLKAAGHRVLMFTQMTAVMTILEDYFRYRGFTSLRLDGSTPADERERRMYKFNAPDSPYFIFLLSTRAGGLGLNLATADVVIIFDSDWNPMMDLQAQDRAHRIGQRSDVSVFRLVTYSPVEEKIMSRANEKLNMSELIVEAGKFTQDSIENDNSMERRRMMEILLTDFESNVKSQDRASQERSDDGEDDDDEKDSTSSSLEINELLSNNEQDYQLYSDIDEQRGREARLPLYTDLEDIPDWIRYPSGSKEDANKPAFDPAAGRKRTAVAYDDGLTEKQFLRLMEKQIQEDEANSRKRKRDKLSSKGDYPAPLAVSSVDGKPGSMTDWTFRKLINISKSVIALKDPATKRRLSEIFLEKPDPNVYPDYYDVIDHPVAINDILRKCRGKLFVDLSEFWEDWKRLFENAKKYNGEESWVANDADALKKELDRLMKKNGFVEEPPPSKRKPLRIKLSLKAVKAERDSTDEPPLKQPSKKKRKAEN